MVKLITEASSKQICTDNLLILADSIGIAEKLKGKNKGALASKKNMQCQFFSKASLAGLTNYVIRHISKYGKIMSSFFVMLMPRKQASQTHLISALNVILYNPKL